MNYGVEKHPGDWKNLNNYSNLITWKVNVIYLMINQNTN